MVKVVRLSPVSYTHLRRIVEHTAEAYGATATLEYIKKVPPTINDPKASELAERVVIDTLGKDKLSKMRKVMPGEDFAWYLQDKPCLLYTSRCV